MYSGTVASYRYGRTIRGHYPYVATHRPIWTAHPSSHALIVLVVYAVLGAGVALIAYRLRTHTAAVPAAG
jgi:hypothetical protein